MRNITGPPVEGDDFFGRDDELSYCWNLLVDGNNLVLPSPRRVGKTSFALKLIEMAKGEGWTTVSINLEEYSREIDFLQELLSQLKNQKDNKINERWDKLTTRLKRFFPSEVGVGDIKLKWSEEKEYVYKEVAELLDHSKPTLIYLDELTVILNNIFREGGRDKVSFLMHWMRKLRITSKSKIRWLYTSSVGIENFTHQHGLSDTMNDVSDFKLKTFDKEASLGLLSRLAEHSEVKFEEAIDHRIIEKLDYCLPYFLQLLRKKIVAVHQLDKLPLNKQIVDHAYGELIREKHFNTWIERIEEQYGEYQLSAHLILKLISANNKGRKKKQIKDALINQKIELAKVDHVLSQLLYMLTNDGYLIEIEKSYVFLSPLLRDFWKNRYLK